VRRDRYKLIDVAIYKYRISITPRFKPAAPWLVSDRGKPVRTTFAAWKAPKPHYTHPNYNKPTCSYHCTTAPIQPAIIKSLQSPTYLSPTKCSPTLIHPTTYSQWPQLKQQTIPSTEPWSPCRHTKCGISGISGIWGISGRVRTSGSPASSPISLTGLLDFRFLRVSYTTHPNGTLSSLLCTLYLCTDRYGPLEAIVDQGQTHYTFQSNFEPTLSPRNTTHNSKLYLSLIPHRISLRGHLQLLGVSLASSRVQLEQYL
jgi:hypothetical protein